MKHLVLLLALGGALALLTGVAGASTVVTTPNGTWTAYPGQSASYSAAVQQPIDSGNTSNWSAKSKGAIPIMFKLSSGTGPFVFQSIWSDNPGITTNDYSFLEFDPTAPPTLAQITKLIANYQFTLGDCQGGSLRWTLYLNDGGVTRNLDIHYQPGHDSLSDQFCQPGTSGTNRVDLTSSDPYVVINQFVYPGSPYTFTSANPAYNTTYADAVSQLGNLQVLGMNLALDSGWGVHSDQVVNLSSATVGVGGASPYEETFTPQPASAPAPTCNLPTATLRITKLDPAPDGPINEEPVQTSLVDNGNHFRVVDCKYQYNLSIPSLRGAGTYRVEIQIAGSTVGTAQFDLK
jgi:hypothetical protein